MTTSDLSARDALLAAIEDSPADTTVRLVLADWYEEQGDADAAAEQRQAIEQIPVAAALLAAARAGGIVAEITGEESIPALADPSGPDCYPVCYIRVSAGCWSAETVGWKACWWEEGPIHAPLSRRFGHGWHWLTDDNDGCSCGRPTVTADADHGGVEIGGADNIGGTQWVPLPGLGEAEIEEVADAIRDALDGAYAGWSPQDADDEEIREALLRQRHADVDVEADVDDETVKVGIYAGTHAGRPVYAVEGDESGTVYDDPREAAEAARDLLAERLRDAARAAEEMPLDAVEEDLRRAVRED